MLVTHLETFMRFVVTTFWSLPQVAHRRQFGTAGSIRPNTSTRGFTAAISSRPTYRQDTADLDLSTPANDPNSSRKTA